MTNCHFVPKDIEIKRIASGAWEPLPENARVNMDALTGNFELVESFDGTFPVTTSLYDVRDSLRPSWRAEREKREAYTFTMMGEKGPFIDRILKDTLELELALLRRTIGSAPWLDYLDDEQWRVLVDEIMPAFRKAETLRGGINLTVERVTAEVFIANAVRFGRSGISVEDFIEKLERLSDVSNPS